VTTGLGAVRGTQSAHADVDMFLGVPYAAPPLGRLRFMPAEPPPKFAEELGSYDATQYRSPSVRADRR
jgi:carboxylesterase type B